MVLALTTSIARVATVTFQSANRTVTQVSNLIVLTSHQIIIFPPDIFLAFNSCNIDCGANNPGMLSDDHHMIAYLCGGVVALRSHTLW
jgi:hypothetical protein